MNKAYKHGEAFCHMDYVCSVGHRVSIWNSRDGVTPFAIRCRATGCTAEASHVDWRKDRRDPDYAPKVGDLVFVAMTPQKAIEYAKARMQHFADAGYDWRETYVGFTFGEAVGFLAYGEFYQGGESPDLIEVTQEWIDERAYDKAYGAELNRRLASGESLDGMDTWKPNAKEAGNV